MVQCGSLFAARLAADRDLADCDTSLLDSSAPSGCEGMTPNACADLVFEQPQTRPANGSHNQFLVQLPRCVDGSDACTASERLRCADGTRSFVYIDKAVDGSGNDIDSDNWLFFGDASGANCDSAETCADRYGTLGTNGMSGYEVARSRAGQGVLDARATRNPFHDFNRVFVNRCTSDSLAGRGAPTTTIAGATYVYEAPIFHHGALGYEALFRHLATAGGLAHSENGVAKTLPSFASADRVVLVGFSGSSRGLAHNGDAFAAVIAGLTGNQAAVKLVFDAAFSPSLENELHWNESGDEVANSDLFNHTARPIPTSANPVRMEPDEDGPGEDLISSASFEVGGATREGLRWWGAQEDASCLAEHGADYAWHCAEREHVIANHITTDLFIAHRLYDTSEVGSPTGIPVHGWMHSRAACALNRTVEACYNWHDDDYRDRSRFQLQTLMAQHATSGEEQPYAGSYAAFATEAAGHEGLIDTMNMTQSLGRCDGGVIVPGTSVRLVDAVRSFVDGTLPGAYWHAVEGLPHPAGGTWASPSRCQ